MELKPKKLKGERKKMDDVKIITIDKRESFVRVELEYDGELYGGLLIKQNGISEKSKE